MSLMVHHLVFASERKLLPGQAERFRRLEEVAAATSSRGDRARRGWRLRPVIADVRSGALRRTIHLPSAVGPALETASHRA